MQATFSGLGEWSGNKEIMSRAPQVMGMNLRCCLKKLMKAKRKVIIDQLVHSNRLLFITPFKFFQVCPGQLGHVYVLNRKMASYNQNLLLCEQPYFVASGVSRIGIFRYNPILGYNSRNMGPQGHCHDVN